MIYYVSFVIKNSLSYKINNHTVIRNIKNEWCKLKSSTLWIVFTVDSSCTFTSFDDWIREFHVLKIWLHWCWWRNVLMTTIRCWWRCHDVTNITMSLTSLSLPVTLWRQFKNKNLHDRQPVYANYPFLRLHKRNRCWISFRGTHWNIFLNSLYGENFANFSRCMIGAGRMSRELNCIYFIRIRTE